MFALRTLRTTKKVQSVQKRGLTISNPHTGAIITTIESDSAASVSSKYSRAKAGQRELVKVPLKQRIENSLKFADLLTKNADELASVLSSEMGKPISQALGEVKATPNRVKFFAEHVAEVSSRYCI